MESRKGMFTASRVGDLLAEGTGKTRMNYIFEIAEELVEAKKDFKTPAMEHGIMNERTAIEILMSIHGGEPNLNTDGEQKFYLVNDYLGATPDALKQGEWVADSKCQYSIAAFFGQNDKLARKYYLQVQTQMMALNVDRGFLINYLTKPEKWGDDSWTEYPFPLEDRYFIHEIKKDEEAQYNILKAAEKYHPLIGECYNKLLEAIDLEEDEFFYMQFASKKRYKKLKDTNWLASKGDIYRHDNTFYV